MNKIPLTKNSDIPITNKDNWIYNNYHCRLICSKARQEEYDTFDTRGYVHNLWNNFTEREGIEIIWN